MDLDAKTPQRARERPNVARPPRPTPTNPRSHSLYSLIPWFHFNLMLAFNSMRRVSLSPSFVIGLLLGIGVLQSSSCLTMNNRRYCGRNKIKKIQNDHPSAQFHEALRAKDETRVLHLTKPLPAPPGVPRPISIVGENFPKTLTVTLQPGTNITLLETTRCPDIVEVSSDMQAMVTASTGQTVSVLGTYITGDARSSLVPDYTASIDPVHLGIKYELSEPAKTEIEKFTFSLSYDAKGEISGSIYAELQLYTGPDRKTPHSSTHVTILDLASTPPQAGSTMTTSSQSSNTGTQSSY